MQIYFEEGITAVLIYYVHILNLRELLSLCYGKSLNLTLSYITVQDYRQIRAVYFDFVFQSFLPVCRYLLKTVQYPSLRLRRLQ